MVLQVGDRVQQRGFAWKNEPTRFGTVAELYRGMSTGTGPGIELVAVRWDDTGSVERGYILASGSLEREASNGQA